MARARGPSGSARRRVAWGVAAFALAAAVTLGLYATARVLVARVLAKETRVVANQLAARIQSCVLTRIEMVDQIRREWELGGVRTDDAFVVRAEVLLRSFPGYQALNRIDADGVIRFVHPREPNIAALGRNVAETPAAAVEWKAAVASGQPRVSPPVQLFQAGTGVTAYVATSAHDVPPMTLNGVFRTDTLIPACLDGRDADAFSIDIHDGDVRVFQRASEAVEAELAEAEPIALFNRTWMLRSAPLASHAAAGREPTRLILVNGLPLSAAIGLLVFGLLTIRARAHARERAAQGRLQRLERMEMLGRMAAGIAHDFNNLLTIMLTSVHILRERDVIDVQALDDITDASNRGVGLTKQLVAFGRGDDGPMKPVDLVELVAGMRSILGRLLGSTHALELQLPAGAVTVLGSKVQFEQIVVNLVVNAVAAMPDGGRVTIEVLRVDDRVCLCVTDEGVGIPADVLPKIFEPFFTTKVDGEGSGLGLATVFSHVHRMKGQIDVSSEVGKGTRFAMTFPAHVAGAVA